MKRTAEPTECHDPAPDLPWRMACLHGAAKDRGFWPATKPCVKPYSPKVPDDSVCTNRGFVMPDIAILGTLYRLGVVEI